MDVSERSILMATFAHFTDIAQFLWPTRAESVDF